MRKMLQAALVVFALCNVSLSKEYPLFVRLYDFTVTGALDAVWVTDLQVIQPEYLLASDSGGKPPFRPSYLKSKGGVYQVNIELDSQGTVPVSAGASPLSLLQRRALLRMLRDGYITKEMYSSVEEGVGIWKPSQIRYAILYSSLTVAEARVLFKNKIPWDRVLTAQPGSGFKPNKASDWESADEIWREGELLPPNQVIQITRASLLVARGQEWDEKNGKVVPLPLSWEKAPQFGEIAPLDRKTFPLAAEVSRIHVEDEVRELKGSLVYPLQALTFILKAEARHWGISSDRYATFGWTLSPTVTRYDHKMFGIRPYSPVVRDWFAGNFADALANYHTIPLPQPLPKQMLLFGMLSDIVKRFQVDFVSAREFAIQKKAKGLISREQARGLMEELTRDTFLYLADPERFPEQELPVCLYDYSIQKYSYLAQSAFNLGVQDSPTLSTVVNALKDICATNEPNSFSHRWGEQGVILPADPMNGDKAFSVVFVDNLLEDAVRKHPTLLPAVLETAKLKVNRRLWDATGIDATNIMDHVKQLLDFEVMPYPELVNRLQDRMWIGVRTTSRFIEEQAEALGGKSLAGTLAFKKPGVTIDASPNSVGFKVERLLGEARVIWFRFSDIHWKYGELSCAEAVAKGLLVQLAGEL